MAGDVTSADASAVVTAVQHRSNNFDALRLVGALLVIVGHSYPLLGRTTPYPTVFGEPLQTVGVIIFFSVSGYLITASWGRTGNPLTYLLARSLRIFPALIVTVLLCALVLGPLVTTLPMEEYFGPGTWQYLTQNIRLWVTFPLPGVFDTLPLPSVVNGSLWTLAVEFACYLAVPVVFLAPRVTRPVVVLALTLFAVWLSLRPPVSTPVVYAFRIQDAAALWLYFAAGALLWVLAQHGMRFRTDVAVGLMAFLLLFYAVAPEQIAWVAWLVVPYVVLTIGLGRTPYVARAGRFGDVSYGLYLWAFPVQQLIIQQWGVQRMSVNVVLVTGISTVLAFGSWWLVERPAMSLKERLLRRRTPVPAP